MCVVDEITTIVWYENSDFYTLGIVYMYTNMIYL